MCDKNESSAIFRLIPHVHYAEVDYMYTHENALTHANSNVHLVEVGNMIKTSYQNMNIVWKGYTMTYITKDNFLEIRFLQYKNI